MNRILIVDDDPFIRRMIRSVLELHEYHCKEVENGEIALAWLEHGQIDLVITDIQMPALGGLELLEHLKEKTKYLALPVIILSGNLNESVKKRAYTFGAVAILEKPCNVDELLTTIADALK